MALAVSIAVVKEFIFMEKISSTVLSLTFWTMSSVQGQLLLWLTVTVSSIRFHFIDPSRDTSPQRHRGLLGVSVRAPGETLQWWWLVKSVTWPPPSCSRLLAKDSRQRATLLMAATNWPKRGTRQSHLKSPQSVYLKSPQEQTTLVWLVFLLFYRLFLFQTII